MIARTHNNRIIGVHTFNRVQYYSITTKAVRRALIRIFGGKCEVCGITERLEFAHKHGHDTPVLHLKKLRSSGKFKGGRGIWNVNKDITEHMDAYRLLCFTCHRKYDGWKLGGFNSRCQCKKCACTVQRACVKRGCVCCFNIGCKYGIRGRRT